MHLFDIKFQDGTGTQEYGDSEADVREFLARSFAGLEVASICQL